MSILYLVVMMKMKRCRSDVFASVDASEAGAGNLEVAVRSTRTGVRIPHFLEADDRTTGLFQIRFSPPRGCFHYEIDVAFNDWPVHGQSTTSLEQEIEEL